MYFLVFIILKLFYRFWERSNVRLIYFLKYIVLFYVLMLLYFESLKVVKKIIVIIYGIDLLLKEYM